MKTTITIRKNAQTSTGYELVNGDGTVLAIDKTYPNEPNTLVLPSNTANRKYCNSKKVDEAGELKLEYKESKKLGSTKTKATATDWYDYLSEEEKDQYSTLKENALRRMNDPLEIAKRAYEKAQAEYEALLAEQENKIENDNAFDGDLE